MGWWCCWVSNRSVWLLELLTELIIIIIIMIFSPRPGLRGCSPSSPSPRPTSAWSSSTGRCLSKPRPHILELDNCSPGAGPRSLLPVRPPLHLPPPAAPRPPPRLLLQPSPPRNRPRGLRVLRCVGSVSARLCSHLFLPFCQVAVSSRNFLLVFSAALQTLFFHHFSISGWFSCAASLRE